MPMLRKNTRRAALALSLLASTAGFAAAEDFVLGLATGQTGGLAAYDQPSLAGLKLAIDEINARGGLGGKYPVKLEIKDTRSDTAAAVQAAQELVDQGVNAIITPCDADPSIAAGQITQGAEIPTFTFCGSTPTITSAVGDFMFGTYPADNAQALVLAEFAAKKGYKSAYVLKSADSAYTLKLPEYFATAFEAAGGKVLEQSTYTMGQQDFGAEVTKIKGLNPQPDVIMTAAYEPDFPAFIKQLRAAGVTAPVLGSDGIDTPTTLSLGSVADGLVHTTAGFAVPGSSLEAFNAKYKQATGKEPDTVYIANGYEIGLILDAAAKVAASPRGRDLRDAIANLENVEGVTGPITYKGTAGMPVRSISLVEVKGGARSLVEAVVPEAAKVPAP